MTGGWNMSKLCRPKQGLPHGKRPHNFSSKLVWIVPILILTIGLGAFGANELLKGQLTVTEEQVEKETATSSDDRDRADAPRTTASTRRTPDKLTDEYGDAAKSPAVATAIRKAERQAAYVAKAKEVSDRYEALSHGNWRPGDDPMLAIEYGYVPPGMPPQQAAMLYNTLPNNLKKPHVLEPGSPEWIAKMTGEPMDPETGLPFNLKEQQIQAANQEMLEHHMRQRFGPVYVPPLHRDHNNLAANTSHIANGTPLNVDHQMSLIQAQYGYDGGCGPGSIREMTNSSGTVVYQSSYDAYGRQTQISGAGPAPDFGYAGYYVHQPSGLNFAECRAYSSTLGRWLNRDPIGERGGINLFAYVQNSPINRTDPSGLQGGITIEPVPRLVDPFPNTPGPYTPNPWSGEIPTPWLMPPGQQLPPTRWVLNPDRVNCFVKAERDYETCLETLKHNDAEKKKNPDYKCQDYPKTKQDCEDQYEADKAKCRQLPLKLPAWEI
jgi:RHS repeat-associated protein